MDALREGGYSIVLDRVDHPSQSFAAAVREIIGWCSTPVIAVARSSHMEDTGFLQPLYSDRHDRYKLKNFDSAAAERFAEDMVRRAGLSASNMKEFLAKVLELRREIQERFFLCSRWLSIRNTAATNTSKFRRGIFQPRTRREGQCNFDKSSAAARHRQHF